MIINSIRVLVDDEEISMDVMNEVLGSLNHKIEATENGI